MKTLIGLVFLIFGMNAFAGEHCYDENTTVEILGFKLSTHELLVSEYCFKKGENPSSDQNATKSWYEEDWCRADLYTTGGSKNSIKSIFHSDDPVIGKACIELKANLAGLIQKNKKDFQPLGQAIQVESSDKKRSYEIATLKYPDPLKNGASFVVEKKLIKSRWFMNLIYNDAADHTVTLKNKVLADVEGTILPFYLLFWDNYVTGVSPGGVWTFKLENSRVTTRK